MGGEQIIYTISKFVGPPQECEFSLQSCNVSVIKTVKNDRTLLKLLQ